VNNKTQHDSARRSEPSSQLDFAVLGPVETTIGGKPIALGGSKQRALLAILLLNANHVVSTERLIELLWGEEPPESAINTLQVRVSQLRRALEPLRSSGTAARVLQSRPSGYVLVLEPEQVDLERFQRLANSGRQALSVGDGWAAATMLKDALALWRGPALSDIHALFASAERIRLEELRLATLEDRIEADLALGAHAEVVAELQALVVEHPLRERLCGQLMLALYRCGRQADASAAFHRLREAVDEAQGIEPGPALQQLLTRVLNQDRALELQARRLPHRDSRGHNLPLQVTTFVGREHEVAEIQRLLGRARLVSLVGPPGVGKTRLALQVANGLLGQYRHGIWLIELAPLSDPGLVPQAVASVVTVHEQPGRLSADGLVGELQGRDVLLVLDNCEHLIEGVAAVVDAILRHCPGVRMLATSRERLGLDGEIIVHIAPLRTPEVAGTLPLDKLRQFEAVQLFTNRTTLVVPDFTVTPDNAPTLAQICRRLEGIPLALELAAARMNAVPPEAMLARLDDRFRLLGHSRVAPVHHRTLRTALDWSHGLLAEEEKVLFRRLSIFTGKWRLESAEAVCGFRPLTNDDVVGLLARLVDKSLVTIGTDSADAIYRLLDMVREYAGLQLRVSGEVETARERHARYFLSLAETDRPLLRSLERPTWLARMIQEESNLRAVLEWSATGETPGAAEVGLALASALGPFWESRGLYREGRQWLELLLQRCSERSAARALGLYWAGWLAFRASEPDVTRARAEEARAIAEELDDRLIVAMTLCMLGFNSFLVEQWATGGEYLGQSERLFAALNDIRGLTLVLAYQAQFEWLRGDLTAANRIADRGLALARQADMEVGSSLDTAKSFILFEQGEVEAATARFKDGLSRPNQEATYLLCAMFGIAGVAAAQGRPRRAIRLAGAATALNRKWNLHTGPASSPLYKVFDRLVQPAREALDEAARTQALTEGSLMSEDEAIDYALSDRD